MSKIAKKIRELHQMLPPGVELVAVSKFHQPEEIKEAYDAGQRIFGESRAQELISKIDVLPPDIRWHFIGHLQTNKVKQIVGKISMIESVDTEKLLDVIDKESVKAGVCTNVLMQLHVAKEETKFGFSPDELKAYFRDKKYENLHACHICGVMGMASNVDDVDRIRADFKLIADTFHEIKGDISPELRGFDIISMGMSGDWETAVDEGSTLVRVGTAIFGPRIY
ncbi:MAG: YggS family pyridoxal phosphate-dependent enzyme [Prevotella sp.]|nr:YggS family pyridoxal phosphate-dependent enzyme [Bacteroides sp.]MCM1365967.1 YggS family pyridoxal phosphate-dependent enzyme [Prevotella sp.]MCM1436612.1 YggS family pyridoxal phosphate-dependent enzyme [Prevotella sp.]